MNVDKFGHHVLKKQKTEHTVLIQNNLISTKDGNLDACKKILKNLQTPQDATDAATKEYVDKHVDHCMAMYKTLSQSVAKAIERLTKLETVPVSHKSKLK